MSCPIRSSSMRPSCFLLVSSVGIRLVVYRLLRSLTALPAASNVMRDVNGWCSSFRHSKPTVSPGSALPSRISSCAEEDIAAQQNLHAAQRAALHSAASCALGSLQDTAYGFSILFDPLSILSAAVRAELRSLRCSSSN